MDIGSRFLRLREEMALEGLDYVCVPRGDRYFHEQVRLCDEKLRWLTGFSGSAGCVIVGKRVVGLFVDGRYTVQARRECEGTEIEIHPLDGEGMDNFFAEYGGGEVGVHGHLVVRRGGLLSCEGLEKRGGVRLRVMEGCMVERIWEDRPEESYGGGWLLEGWKAEDVEARSRRIRERMGEEEGCVGLWISGADTICWLLGVRGDDIAELPVILSRGLWVSEGGSWRIVWYVEGDREEEMRLLVDSSCIEVRGMERLGEIEEGLERLYVDSFRTSEFFMRMFEGMGVDVREKRCVARHEQTLKDGRELEGFRLCHKGDGVVMVKLLYEVLRGEGMKESDVERRIESLRGEREDYVEKSFSSIVGSGSNGAIVHYRVGEDTDRELRGGDVVLIDCGGHYRNGTTDVTRTIGLGEVGREEKRLYTRVLRSHVMLSRQSFPKGTTGTQLDAIARSELWNEGLDYGHGTGHGVGYVLGVHESPPVLTKKGGTILEVGMVLSIEPGLYFEGLYGFRVENLVEVEERGEGLGFRALTCVPYARDMIEVEMLSEADRLWVDGYHAWVWTCLEDEGLEEEERLWLWEMTRPLEVVG